MQIALSDPLGVHPCLPERAITTPVCALAMFTDAAAPVQSVRLSPFAVMGWVVVSGCVPITVPFTSLT